MATKPEDKTSKTKKTTTARKPKATKAPSTTPLREAGGKKTSKRAVRLAAKPPCRVAKCKRRYRAKGYCVAHYALWRQNAYGNGRYKQCEDTNCAKPRVNSRYGYCEEHYQAYYVKGQAIAKAPAAAAPAKEEKKKEAAA